MGWLLAVAEHLNTPETASGRTWMTRRVSVCVCAAQGVRMSEVSFEVDWGHHQALLRQTSHRRRRRAVFAVVKLYSGFQILNPAPVLPGERARRLGPFVCIWLLVTRTGVGQLAS